MHVNASLIGLFTLAQSLFSSGCYTHLNQPRDPPSQRSEYLIETTVEGIVYTPADWPQPLHGDLYLPRQGGPRPVVLMVHGGGWANRSRDDMTGLSRKLARQGYAVFNVDYRLAPGYTYPAQLQDMRRALHWITANAARYQLDTGRINAWGYSSGAHLAALVASFDGRAENADLPRIRAVVAGGIPADLRKYSNSPIVMRFMGGDRQQMPARYAEASPAYHISGDDPPVFLYHGKLDYLVGVDQATAYYAALREGGVDVELFLHNWRGHLTLFLFGGEAEQRAIDFLNRVNRRQQFLTQEPH